MFNEILKNFAVDFSKKRVKHIQINDLTMINVVCNSI